MVKTSRAVEPLEIDRIFGQPHPRDTGHLTGQEVALEIASRAIRSGRPPQAWLIAGPPGIGKATLAYRIARYLLRYGASAEGPADLAVDESDAVAMQIRAGAHPGLLVLKRSAHPDTGKLMTVLGVDEIRRLANFFGLTSGAGGWRIGIVDTADDMNDAAANALLKMLEEPPPRAILLLLAHAPSRLLPTIRSRCQRIVLRPISEKLLDAEIARRLPDMPAQERSAIVHLAGGSIGAALRLASDEGVWLAGEAARLIESSEPPEPSALFSLVDKILRVDDGMVQFGAYLTESLAARVRARARENRPGLDRWVAAWEKLVRGFDRAAALHLEPRQTILSSLQALSRQSGSL